MTDGEKNGERMYAITESELKKYEGLFFLDDDATSDFKKIRSRPLTGAQPQDAAAGMLNRLQKRIWEKSITPYSSIPYYYIVPWSDIKAVIEELRTTPASPGNASVDVLAELEKQVTEERDLRFKNYNASNGEMGADYKYYNTFLAMIAALRQEQQHD